MKLLVTGGAGYLGSVLVGHLLRGKHHVTVVDNLLYQVPALYQYCPLPGFHFVRGDVRDESLMRKMLSGQDAIIQLAALVGMPACIRDPGYAQSTNYEAVALLNRLRGQEQWVIYPCTNSGYGAKTGDVFCTEATPLEPISLYGRTKVDAEKLLLDSPNTVSLRLATVFGVSPRLRLDLLVNDFTYRAVKDRTIVLYEKHFKRNYIHIEDVARAFCFVLDNFERLKGQPYNVGLSDANLSKEELALKIQHYVPQVHLHTAEFASDPDKRNYVVSNEKIERAGFAAQHSLDEGIQQLILAYHMMPSSGYVNC